MQGCRQEPSGTASNDQTNNTPEPPAFVATNPPTPSNSQAVTTPPQAPETPVVQTAPSVPQVATDYKIAQGDSFSKLAAKYGVSVRAIADANPGVDSTKLHIGQTLHIPAPKAATTAAQQTTPQPTANDSASGEQLYSVVSGDNLTRIASKYGTTVKALRSANSLTTDSIKVG